MMTSFGVSRLAWSRICADSAGSIPAILCAHASALIHTRAMTAVLQASMSGFGAAAGAVGGADGGGLALPAEPEPAKMFVTSAPSWVLLIVVFVTLGSLGFWLATIAITTA